MGVKQLIRELQKCNPDKVVVLSDGFGWDNIGSVEEDSSIVTLLVSKSIPFSSDN